MGKLGRIATSMNWRYAVGEILLIVIGILIAVQINNWNQERSEKQNIEVLLENLRQDLYDNYNMYVKRDSTNIKRTENILTFVNNIEQIKDTTLLKKYSFPPERLYNEFDPVKATYNQMENNGMIYKITNDSIKKAIIDYYTLIRESQRLLQVQQGFVQQQYNHKDLMLMRENHFNIFQNRPTPNKNLEWLNDFNSDQFKAYKSMVYMIQGIIDFERYQLSILKIKCRDLLTLLEKPH